MTSPGFWTTKATDQFTLELAAADATAACMRAGEDTKGWRIEETEAHRIRVKRMPGFLGSQYTHHVEVLVTDAEGGGTTLTLNGWHFGKGGGKKLIKMMIGEFRSAVEAQVPSH